MNEHLEISGDERIYVITDNHGHAMILERLLDLVHCHIKQNPLKKNQTARILFLGDMNDKGPDTAGVFKILVERMGLGKKGSRNHKYRISFSGLVGNHEYNLNLFLLGSRERFQDTDVSKDLHREMLTGEKRRWTYESLCWFLEGGGLQTAESYGVIKNKLKERFELLRIRVAEIQRRRPVQAAPSATKSERDISHDVLKAAQELDIDFEKIRDALKVEMKRRNHLKILSALYASAERMPTENLPRLAFLHAKTGLLETVHLRDLSLEVKTGVRKADDSTSRIRIRRGAVRRMIQFHGHKSGKTIPNVKPNSIGLDSRIVSTGVGVAMVIDHDQIGYIETASNHKRGKGDVIMKELGTMTPQGDIILHPSFAPIRIADIRAIPAP
ncbi:MAG: hypothetical protein SFW65_01565 [Alphaproteobacteria bacterium]|nr:hypothetical protein [Alphaproteobacteria bacterium]